MSYFFVDFRRNSLAGHASSKKTMTGPLCWNLTAKALWPTWRGQRTAFRSRTPAGIWSSSRRRARRCSALCWRLTMWWRAMLARIRAWPRTRGARPSAMLFWGMRMWWCRSLFQVRLRRASRRGPRIRWVLTAIELLSVVRCWARQGLRSLGIKIRCPFKRLRWVLEAKQKLRSSAGDLLYLNPGFILVYTRFSLFDMGFLIYNSGSL